MSFYSKQDLEYVEGYGAEEAGETQKRWQTRAWRMGWQASRRARREVEFDAHERNLANDACRDPACLYPSCARPADP